MSEEELRTELENIKKEIAEVKSLLTSACEYKEKFPVERLLDLEYLFRKLLIRIEQRLL